MKFISKKDGKYFLCYLHKRLDVNKNFVSQKLYLRKVGKLPTLIYLARNPNSNEDEFINSGKR